jgi:hypothetical protein
MDGRSVQSNNIEARWVTGLGAVKYKKCVQKDINFELFGCTIRCFSRAKFNKVCLWKIPVVKNACMVIKYTKPVN